ncbi:related to mitochondrial amino acid transporter ARG-13 [Melanopsichium pennsylvanicum]|uniref:Related to mitochondrial amino acid transporter ARG-13 n=2 Tax=Melanopsichium pennsylvanicum TaxID=63383 RepID=A0AAJ4XSJ5_9BASI|nr:related to mitochondrial amino acid transporter ARG-13 [Melanopsichium pennsylvanicum 4]SNX86303.1 related to mitochondrial amino acid transporter ARG-13 [Melanopsichium pennsylvanicum]
MKSPELQSSVTFGAPATGLGVVGVALASTSTSSPASPAPSKTPRWGSIRQRFSSLQGRDSPSLPIDSVDIGMWDKNDAAFLEEVARDSPSLLASPDRFDSLAPVFEDTYAGRSSMSSPRVHSFIPSSDADLHASSHRLSQQPRPSSASGSTPSPSASAASAWSTPINVHEDVPGQSASLKPWPRAMRRMASATMLPDLPEQNRLDDVTTLRRPSTSSSASASTSPPLLPPIRCSISFKSHGYANVHTHQSPNGSSANPSMRSSPSIPHSVPVPAGGESTRSALAEHYPRSPSLHSSSPVTNSTHTFRSPDDRNLDTCARTNSSFSATSFGFTPSVNGMDRRTSRSVVGIPLALRTSFTSSRPSSPDAFLHDDTVASSPILSRIAIEHGAAAFTSGSMRRPSIASVLDLPASQQQHLTDSYESFPHRRSADIAASPTTAAARGKREASASMRGMPGSPTKRTTAVLAPASTSAVVPQTSQSASQSSAPVPVVRKHTKNKSSLVSGLRKLMGKRERESKGAATSTDTIMATGIASGRPTSPALKQSSISAQISTIHQDSTRSRAMSFDVPIRGGLNLLGLAPNAFGPEATAELSHERIDGQAETKSSTTCASPSMTRRSPSLDLLRSFGTMGRVSQGVAADSAEERQAPPASPHSRTKSIDGLMRPLRDVLTQRPRKDSQNGAARASVIEHVSHNEARQMTGSAGPVILKTKEALEEHRSRYAIFPTEFSVDRSLFDLDHQTWPSQANVADAASRQNMAKPPSSWTYTNMQSPERPPRPEQASPHGAESIELLTPSNSGGAVSVTGSSNVGGISSSGSSFISSSSNATDPSIALRAPFSFQSQAYRPYSRESRDSSTKTPSSSPSTPGSVAITLSGESALGTSNSNHKPLHCCAPSLGSLAAYGQTYDLGSSMIPPPASAQTVKRGHTSRRSLNGLVSNKQWSSFLSSPVLGISSSLSHGEKRVSTACISRPLSVSSSVFSTDFDSMNCDAADLTLRASDFSAVADITRLRVDSTHSNFSEPGFQGWKPNSTAGNYSSNVNDSSNSDSHCYCLHALGNTLSSSSPSPSGSHLGVAPLVASSSSSHLSNHSHQSHPFHPNSNAAAASISASSTIISSNLADPSYRLIPTPSSSTLGHQHHQAPCPLRNHAASHDEVTTSRISSPQPGNGANFQALQDQHTCQSTKVTSSASTVFPPTALGSASRSRPAGAGHRASNSASSLSHRKRPSFGLAIEPAAHSAFDSIPSPLLRTRRISLALTQEAVPQRPFSFSSASVVGRTPSGSSSSTSPVGSSRASAATLSSNHVFDEDNIEIETLRDSSQNEIGFAPNGTLLAAPPLFNSAAIALESAMAAASLQSTSDHRHSVSVPMDEGDSPRQHQEESWNRATGGVVLTYDNVEESQLQESAPRQYMIHSPNEEEAPPLSMPDSSSSRFSQASKDIAFGSIAGMVSKVFEHPFDLVKVRLQTQSADRPPRYGGAFDCFKQTYLHEGIRGLYRGLSMPVIGATLENACLFFTYNQIQSAIRWANGDATNSASAAKADAERPLSIPQLAIAAAGAGAVTSLVLTPIELIKCKMQVQMITREQHAPVAATVAPVQAQLQHQTRSLYTPVIRSSAASTNAAQALRTLDGPLTLLRRTIAADGIRGLWLGQTGTLLRETGGGVAWFLAFESCSRYLIARKKAASNRTDITKKDLTSLELVGSGALAGISYNVVLFPADCVKSTMQTEQEMRAVNNSWIKGPQQQQGEKWKGTGFYDTFKKIYKTRGIKGLYAGCGVTCLRSAPSSAIIFLMYNKLEKLSDENGF